MAKVNVIGKGRSGKIHYTEGSLFKKYTCEFYWEIGDGDTIATIWFPTKEKWDAAYPWAAGRHKEVMDIVANETRKQMAKSSTIKWEDDRFHLAAG